jgi:hypothetical protein
VITIEKVDNLQLHLGGGGSILTSAVLAGLLERIGQPVQGVELSTEPAVQTSAGVPAFDAAAAGEAFENQFHKVRAEVSREWWDKIWRQALDWAAAKQPATASAPPALGAMWEGQGGHYGGTMPERNGKPGYHLIVASLQGEDLKYGPYNLDVAGAGDHWDGQVNTEALAANMAAHPAAHWARSQAADGHTDFYLPAHAELMQLWINVPQLFKPEGWYWTSTQSSPSGAWVQDFEGGHSRVDSKDREFRAVAVRRLAL